MTLKEVDIETLVKTRNKFHETVTNKESRKPTVLTVGGCQ